MKRELKGRTYPRGYIISPKEVTRHIPMKRELKGLKPSARPGMTALVTRHIPMKRELKVFLGELCKAGIVPVTRHIPMKRELKVVCLVLQELGEGEVTRHIPMKRELKGSSRAWKSGSKASHKAYPDEKGTER